MFKIITVAVLLQFFQSSTTSEDYNQLEKSNQFLDETNPSVDSEQANEIKDIYDMFYKNYKFDERLDQKTDEKQQLNNLKTQKLGILNDLDELILQLDKIAAKALNKLSGDYTFEDDFLLIDVINKADEDDMDGIIEEKQV